MKKHSMWSTEEIEYLDSRWGEVSIPAIANFLERSIGAVRCKVFRVGLTRHLHSGGYITLNQLMIALGRGAASFEATLA